MFQNALRQTIPDFCTSSPLLSCFVSLSRPLLHPSASKVAVQIHLFRTISSVPLPLELDFVQAHLVQTFVAPLTNIFATIRRNQKLFHG
jgi:hypothetical protein